MDLDSSFLWVRVTHFPIFVYSRAVADVPKKTFVGSDGRRREKKFTTTLWLDLPCICGNIGAILHRQHRRQFCDRRSLSPRWRCFPWIWKRRKSLNIFTRGFTHGKSGKISPQVEKFPLKSESLHSNYRIFHSSRESFQSSRKISNKVRKFPIRSENFQSGQENFQPSRKISN